MIVIVYLLVFPGIIAVAFYRWQRAENRYLSITSGRDLWPRQDPANPYANLFISGFRRMMAARSTVDRMIKGGELGVDAVDALADERRTFYQLAASIPVSMVGALLLAPVLRLTTEATGQSTDVLAVLIMFAIGLGTIAVLILAQLRRAVRGQRPAHLVVGYAISFLVVLVVTIVLVARGFRTT